MALAKEMTAARLRDILNEIESWGEDLTKVKVCLQGFEPVYFADLEEEIEGEGRKFLRMLEGTEVFSILVPEKLNYPNNRVVFFDPSSIKKFKNNVNLQSLLDVHMRVFRAIRKGNQDVNQITKWEEYNV